MSLAAISDKATDTSTLLALAADETNMQLDAGATNESEDHKKGKGGSYGVSMVMVDADERVRVSYNTKRGSCSKCFSINLFSHATVNIFLDRAS